MRLYLVTIVVGIGGAVLSLVSRFRISPNVNDFFYYMSGGEPSLVEHFFGGMAVLAIALFFILFLSLWVKKRPFKKARLRDSRYIIMRKYVFKMVRPIYVVRWVFVIALAYVGGSFYWEFSQMLERGYFQYNQYMMDVLGAFAFFGLSWLMLRESYVKARIERRLSFI